MALFRAFRAARNPQAALEQVLTWLDVFVKEGQAAYDNDESADQLAKRLLVPVLAQLAEKGAKQPHRVMPYIEMDLQVSAQGLLDYYDKRGSGS